MIEELIIQTNLIIDSADTKEKINQAKAARDSALNIINNQEKKIQSVLDQILQMEIYITIFDTIVSIILAIPIPSSVPPGIGVPVNLIIKLQRLLATAEKIASGLSLLLAIFIATIFLVNKKMGPQKKLRLKKVKNNNEKIYSNISSKNSNTTSKLLKFIFILFTIGILIWVISNIPSLWWIVFSAVLAALAVYEYSKRNRR